MTLLNILLWIIFGGIAGWIASKVMHRDAQMGMIANIIVGIVGAILGGFIMNFLGFSPATGFSTLPSLIYSLFVAVIGAIVLLFIVGLVRRV